MATIVLQQTVLAYLGELGSNAPLQTPTVNPTGGGAGGGSLAAGTYYAKYTYVSAAGESIFSPESAAFTVAAGNIPRVTLPTKPSGISSLNLYLTPANGGNDTEVLYATGITGTTTDLSSANAGTVSPPLNSNQFLALTILQATIEQMVQDYLGWQAAQQTFVEYYPEVLQTRVRDELIDTAPFEVSGGNAVQFLGSVNSNTLIIRNSPVRSVTSVNENPAAWSNGTPPSFPLSTQLREGADYLVDYESLNFSRTAFIRRLTGSWVLSPWFGRSIQVTYVAGYTASEIRTLFPRIYKAILDEIMFAYKQAKLNQRDGVTTNFQGGMGGGAGRDSLKMVWGLSGACMRNLEENVSMKKFLPV